MEEKLRQLPNTGSSKIIKIALFGPESTGKTTLAIQLAEYYNTACVPEFAREYLQEKWDNNGEICDVNDMLPIAYGQTKLENDSLPKADKFLFCDTNLMVTKVFSEVYYNYCDPLLDQAALEHDYDLFFLTDIDVPWEKDDLRDKPEGRDTVFAIFKQTLIHNNKPFITLSGNKDLRLSKAITIINDLVKANEMGFTSLDFVQIYEHEIPLDIINNQLNYFRNGIAKADLVEAATLENGIFKLSDIETQQKAVFFDNNKVNYQLNKFVPASGAASRMFKFLSEFMSEFDIEKESIHAYINRKKDTELSIFIVGLDKFPFFDDIYTKLKEIQQNFDTLESDYKIFNFIKILLSSDYFNFANKPKGILPFHKYPTHIANPIEEHLYECANYSSSKGKSQLHFTISEIHQREFEKIINTTKKEVEQETEAAIEVSFSYQNKKTDTIAVDLANNPLRDELGKLVFRPGGHGALIDNLNQLDSDIIFIKNIDNVVQNHKETNTLYKKVLAGILIELQLKIFEYLNNIENNIEVNLEEIIAFAKNNLNIKTPNSFSKYTVENKMSFVKKTLNRPIRVCGMVTNEGDTGGGPFWVRDTKGRVSLQIVETSQIDLKNPTQVDIFKKATHFNPVDLICCIQNHKNDTFDLTQFVNHESGFIVEKNKNGHPLKGYELPGLWNGAMAKWITVFIEVPLITFNPVKTVNDLLKPTHQP
jgi:nicotinamide riboside kinase